ncbi:putative addiction module antidote protein [Variovorax sp. PBL-H6]|uniref:addiction module antidote protein n=1 Tax=Variovorax sp. PBL-H6 TaxID=434009 RepID=UPI001319469C|nr:putative addiction module antidote protein [Variovorax sp. PBL-H6]
MNKDAAAKFGISKYDTSDHLRNDEEARLYLMACIEEAGDDAAYIAKALGKIAKSRVAMADIAQKTGLSRESLYKALSGERDPSFSTILKVSSALGLRLLFSAEGQAAEAPAPQVQTAIPATTTRHLVYSAQKSALPRLSPGASGGYDWEEWSANFDPAYSATAFMAQATARSTVEGIELWTSKVERVDNVEGYGKSPSSFFIEDLARIAH